MSGPSTDAAPAGAAADYEALRCGVLAGARGDRDLGLALLLRRGMAVDSGLVGLYTSIAGAGSCRAWIGTRAVGRAAG